MEDLVGLNKPFKYVGEEFNNSATGLLTQQCYASFSGDHGADRRWYQHSEFGLLGQHP